MPFVILIEMDTMDTNSLESPRQLKLNFSAATDLVGRFMKEDSKVF